MATVNGTNGQDFIHRAGDGRTPPAGSNEVTGVTAAADLIDGLDGADTIYGDGGNDTITGGEGDDVVLGEGGDDTAIIDATFGLFGNDGADRINLSSGSDVVQVGADNDTNVRLTFTSAEVGNGSTNDSGNLANQDGALAVRLQSEFLGTPSGEIDRIDDEGVTFVGGAGVTFDVRDLVSGAARGELFEVVTLGTSAGDRLLTADESRPYYINGGQGQDTISGGAADDFLVGGAANDRLVGQGGQDSFIGGAGDDVILGGDGDDTAIFNVSTDNCDRVNLGTGSDVVNVSKAEAGQVRLTFTSAEVGNNQALDSGMLANQDGGLAVRMRAENAGGAPAGDTSKYDDEGITFVSATAGVTFDVRDLVTGVARGDGFEVVTLGTQEADRLEAVQDARPYYINAGQGDDVLSGGTANDFLVGGAGRDYAFGAEGNDSLLGGGGNDTLRGGDGDDTSIFNISTDGSDRVNLDEGSDFVNVSAAAAGQVRLTFTSAEVGNGSAVDSGALANQDGLLAVRMRAENGSDVQTGALSRYDDEGITFVSSTAGLTFDVRDLVSGVARGDGFEIVTLGTSADDTLTAVQAARSYYINAGGGEDDVSGGANRDFLVGGAGADTLDGDSGHDSLLGGGGADTFSFSAAIGIGANNIETIVDFAVADDTIQLDSAAFAGLTAGGLSADAFATGTEAADADDRIIYDSAGGRLLFDQDGTGTAFGAVRFANITTGLALTNDDFTVF